MTIVYELSLENFQPWGGAVNTFDRIVEECKCDELERILEDLYPNGMTETELNDILWFESENIFEWLGIRTEDKIQDEIDSVYEELRDLEDAFEDEVSEAIDEINSNREVFGMNELDTDEIESLRSKLWADEYSEDAESLKDKISELEDELENL